MMFANKMKIITAAVVAAVLALPLIGLSDESKPPTNIAEVNGKVLTYKEFERQMDMFKQQVLRGQPGDLPEAMMEKLKERVLNQMIAEELLSQESARQSIRLENGFVDNELKSIKKRFANDEEYQQFLKRIRLTEEQLKDLIAHQAIMRRLVDKEVGSHITITKEDAKKYYQANMDKFHQPERVRAQHILIKTESGDSEQKKAAARKKIEEIKKKVLAGEDFGKLAKQYSEGPSNVRGGDLGYFTRGRMVKPFEDVAFKLAPNEVSDVVETEFGYHLIKVLDHQPEKSFPFEEVEPRIMAQLRTEMIQEKVQPYVEKLREKAKIQIFLK
jgi:peptidyl-prolyl cis-trans isomerase C